jgi:hypothetical protein
MCKIPPLHQLVLSTCVISFKRMLCERTGDGDLDNDDIELMNSLLPPEPYNDWMRILHPSERVEGTEDQSLEGNYGYMRTLFRRYAVEGTVGMDDVEDMGIGQFKNFAKEIQIMNKTDLNAGAIDRMFIRANQDRSEGVDQFNRENMGKVGLSRGSCCVRQLVPSCCLVVLCFVFPVRVDCVPFSGSPLSQCVHAGTKGDERGNRLRARR